TDPGTGPSGPRRRPLRPAPFQGSAPAASRVTAVGPVGDEGGAWVGFALATVGHASLRGRWAWRGPPPWWSGWNGWAGPEGKGRRARRERRYAGRCPASP